MPPFIFNIPNFFTLVRLFMVPIVIFPLLPMFGEYFLERLIVVNIFFTLAIGTDYLDGYLARILDQRSAWGAYMDPLIDKLVIWALYFMFLLIPKINIPIWTFVVIVTRDLLVTAMRNYALKHSVTFKTSFLAKCKTSMQMFSGGGILFFLLITCYLNESSQVPFSYYLDYWGDNYILMNFPSLLVQGVAIFTVITGLDYAYMLYKNIKKEL